MSFFEKAIPLPTPETLKWKSLLEVEEESFPTKDTKYKYYYRADPNIFPAPPGPLSPGQVVAMSSCSTVTVNRYLTDDTAWYLTNEWEKEDPF